LLVLILIKYYLAVASQNASDCQIPLIIRGSWFSYENKNENTEINANTLSKKKSGVNMKCVNIREEYHVNYTFVFQDFNTSCYHCVKLIVRTVNVLEKLEGK